MHVDIVNAREFSRKFKEYGAIYGGRHNKTLDVILLERARKLAIALYQETAAIAPTRAEIAADVQKLGWKIPARFPDGRLGRGTREQWIGNAIAELPKRRGRKTKKRGALEDSIRSRTKEASLAMMQAFVIRLRFSHIKFIASGWLGAVLDLGGSLKVTSGKVDKKRGRAEITPDGVTLVNDSPGVTEANAKHGFVKKALAAQIADMSEYITSRLSQARRAA